MTGFRQEATVLLALIAETCTVSINALHHQSSSSSAKLQDIHKDLLSILALIHHSTTKLSIALNPSDVIYQASISPLKDLVQHINALSSCSSLINDITHGKTLRAEAIDLVTDVLLSLNALVNTFLSVARDSAPNDDYLIRTGTIHNLIDNARSSSGLSPDNLQAVKKKWNADRKTLEDAYEELSQMSESVEEDDFLEDDEWDELGLDTKKLTPEEVERVKKIQPFLRISTLLHKRVLLDLLSVSPPSLPTNFIASLDRLAEVSSTFVSATDDLVATLYGPQDPSSIPPALESVSQIAKYLQSILIESDFLNQCKTLEDQLASLEIDKSNATPKTIKGKDKSRWFDTCFMQIDKLCISLCQSFRND